MKRLLTATIGLSFLLRAFSQDFETIESPREVGIENTTKDSRLHLTAALAQKNELLAGKPIILECQLSGVANANLYFADHNRASDLKVEVRDQAGKKLPCKVAYKADLEEVKRSFLRLDDKPLIRFCDVQTYSDIRKPGLYRVTVICPISTMDGEPDFYAASNPLELDVK